MSVLIARMADTEKQVIHHLEGIDTDMLFWARVDTGKDYLRTMYGDKIATSIQKHPEFWTWFRWIWHDNDVSILDWMIEEDARLDWEDYQKAQLVRAMRMEPPKRLLKDWLK